MRLSGSLEAILPHHSLLSAVYLEVAFFFYLIRRKGQGSGTGSHIGGWRVQHCFLQNQRPSPPGPSSCVGGAPFPSSTHPICVALFLESLLCPVDLFSCLYTIIMLC